MGKIVRTRPAPLPAPGAARVTRKRQEEPDEESDRSVNGEEKACYLIRLNLFGSHPNWYDSYAVINVILKKAQEEIQRKTQGGTCYFDMVYWPEEEVDRGMKKKNLKFEKVKQDE